MAYKLEEGILVVLRRYTLLCSGASGRYCTVFEPLRE